MNAQLADTADSAKSAANADTIKARLAELLDASKLFRFTPLFAFSLVGLLIFGGWRISHNQYLIAEEGLGYWLGIVGASMMVLLLLYPLRKKAAFMRRWGPIKHWFRAHMILGTLGPVLVLYHANFGLGSLNSSIALICTLVVAGSGLIGRYFYGRIHYGLYGSKASVEKLNQDARLIKGILKSSTGFAPQLVDRLEALEERLSRPERSLIKSTVRIIDVGLRSWWTYWVLLGMTQRAINEEARRSGWRAGQKRKFKKNVNRYVRSHLLSMRKIAGLGFYERLFALWHLLHLPLFILLIISAIVHILAVHLY